ncbi:MAG: terpene cyclase/mutase family protein [Planctomycetes bacterium]|nr:terpene cyclase/mutase family protein [Planctomycetota bacterium]
MILANLGQKFLGRTRISAAVLIAAALACGGCAAPNGASGAPFAPTAPRTPASAGPAAPVAPPAPPAAAQAPRPTKKNVEVALDRACNWLATEQQADGAYGMMVPDVGPIGDVGITALVIQALADSPRGYREEDGPFISKAVEYLLTNAHPDGGIYNADQGLENYKTSVAVLALAALDRGRPVPRYAETIKKARAYIAKLQCAEDSEQPYHPAEHKRAYGGIGYGSDLRPDLSNTQFALEALAAAGLSEDSDVYQRALTFLGRCQNLRAANDAFDDKDSRSTEDGGFFYAPGESKAGEQRDAAGTVSYSSYGSMTYAGVKSYIYAGLTKDDPRVRAALDWIRRNFTVKENPGVATPANPERGSMGLYYYYVVMARTLDLLGEETLVLADGTSRAWAKELAAELLATQSAKGTWVNRVDRWWEGSEQLTTAYAVIALSLAARHLKG